MIIFLATSSIFAQKKISELPTASAVNSSDYFVIVQSGSTKSLKYIYILNDISDSLETIRTLVDQLITLGLDTGVIATRYYVNEQLDSTVWSTKYYVDGLGTRRNIVVDSGMTIMFDDDFSLFSNGDRYGLIDKYLRTPQYYDVPTYTVVSDAPQLFSGSNKAYIGMIPISTDPSDVGYGFIYIDSDSLLTYKDPSGNVTSVIVTDHGGLDGLSDDDHPQYALLNGRNGNVIKVDDIDEYTAAHGVDVDGVLLKDGDVYTVNGGVVYLGTDLLNYMRESATGNKLQLISQGHIGVEVDGANSLTTINGKLNIGTTNVSASDTSESGYGYVMADNTDGKLYWQNDAGTLYDLTGGGGTTYKDGNGIDIIGDSIAMGDTIYSSIQQKLLSPNYYRMSALATIGVYDWSDYYMDNDSMSWKVFNFVETGDNIVSLTTDQYRVTFLDVPVLTINQNGTTIDDDSVFLPSLVQTYEQWLGITATGKIFADSLDTAGEGLTINLESPWKRLYDRKDGEIKNYYKDESKNLTYRYGQSSNVREAIYSNQFSSEINLRYIAQLYTWNALHTIITLLLLAFIIITRKR